MPVIGRFAPNYYARMRAINKKRWTRISKLTQVHLYFICIVYCVRDYSNSFLFLIQTIFLRSLGSSLAYHLIRFSYHSWWIYIDIIPRLTTSVTLCKTARVRRQHQIKKLNAFCFKNWCFTTLKAYTLSFFHIILLFF